MIKKKILLIVLIVIFSFVLVSLQYSTFLPLIIERTPLLHECTFQEKLNGCVPYIVNEGVNENNLEIVLLFIGYAWVNTILFDIIIYKFIKKKLYIN